jgi:hypothetical protein
VLSIVEGEVLAPRVIDDLLSVVQTVPDTSAQLEADRERLRKEIDNMLDLAAAGTPATTVAPKIRERETEIARIKERLRRPRPHVSNLERLREALTLRTAEWKADLRGESKVARLVLRRLTDPITLWMEPRPEWVRWKAPAKPASLLDGLVQDGTSPTGHALMYGDDSIRIELAGDANERAA